MPPPADGFVARLLVGPALRAQPDGRLVTLVREGYEAAFEEIVRRYRAPLRRCAAAIVGGSADDVTQDALSKAFLALRRDDSEIELRPWLYRILRNTALNDLRDRPPTGAWPAESIPASSGVAEEVERREEVGELISRLQALPEAQRAAIVMRELEGLGHDEIAVSLGISGGAARQAIHRARTALRDGLGMAIPLPLVRLLIEGGAPAAQIAGGGAGVGIALKAATATVLVAGTLGAGLALHESGHDGVGAGRALSQVEAATDGSRGHAVAGGIAAERLAPARAGGGGESSPNRGHGRNVSGRSDSGPRQPEPHGQDGGGRSSEPANDAGPGGGTEPNSGSQSGDRSGSSSSGGGEDGGGAGSDGSSTPLGGETQDGEGVSGSGEGSGSNSGPDSGGGAESSGSGSGDLRDPGEIEGFSVQTQPQAQEEK
jgi:RNA polymerase sigma factor (sigma-70 family)